MIETIIADDEWDVALPGAEGLALQCLEEFRRVEPASTGEIALLLTDDEAVKNLNAKFRGQDKPTNVLSFPSNNDDDFLGDIALARETCVGEASDRGIALRDHVAHLIVHGLLHLAGYDHQTESDAQVMERREIEILQTLGIADPYAGAEVVS